MGTSANTVSITRSGKRRYWVLLPPMDAGADPTGLVIDEGTADTDDEALAAGKAAAARAGLKPPVPGARHAADWVREDRRAAKAGPTAATFQGSSHLFSFHTGWDNWGREYCQWEKHVITKVTAKSVWVLSEGPLIGQPDWKRDVRLEKSRIVDRAALERDGVAVARRETFYTDAARAAHDAAWHEDQRRKREAQAKATEEYRRSLDGKACVYCGAQAETHSPKNEPCCKPCYKARIDAGAVFVSHW